jgi:hypothetical protein
MKVAHFGACTRADMPVETIFGKNFGDDGAR